MRHKHETDIAVWWLDHVVFLWFNLAKGRIWPLKVLAMTLGTLWVMLTLLLSVPILFVAMAQDVWKSLD